MQQAITPLPRAPTPAAHRTLPGRRGSREKQKSVLTTVATTVDWYLEAVSRDRIAAAVPQAAKQESHPFRMARGTATASSPQGLSVEREASWTIPTVHKQALA